MLIKKGTQGTNYYKDPEKESFRYNPYRKYNRVKAEESYKTNEILPFPLHVIIEVSSLCNLKCSFCNREVMTRPQKNMDMETFKKVVDECAENRVHSLSLYCLGEPFLNPDLREMIIYAKGKGIPYVDVSTNGMKDMTSVVGTGLDEIIVSLDGFKETHEKLRKGADFDLIVYNLSKLLNARKDKDTIRPLIRIQIIDIPETKDQIDDFIRLFQDFCDVVYVKNLEVFSQNLGDKNLPYQEIVTRLNNRVPCKQLWFVLTVNSDWSIAACCHDSEGKSILKSKTLKEAWGEIKDARERHRIGNYSDFNELCSQCTDWSW